MLEKLILPKEFRPNVSLSFCFKSSTLLSPLETFLANRSSFSSGFDGGYGGKSVLVSGCPSGLPPGTLVSTVCTSLSTPHLTMRCIRFRSSLIFSPNMILWASYEFDLLALVAIWD